MQTSFELDGRTALVTGASRGLGMAIAAGLLLAGGSALYDLAVLTAVFLAGVRSVGVIIGTFVDSNWRDNEVFYQ